MVYFKDSRALKAGQWTLADVKQSFPESDVELFSFSVVTVRTKSKDLQKGFILFADDPDVRIQEIKDAINGN